MEDKRRMARDQDQVSDARMLRRLARLVTALTTVMIVGVVAIVVLMALRLNRPAPLALPADVRLPAGAKPEAVTLGPGWLLVVTRDGAVLVYDRDTGRLRQTLRIDGGAAATGG